MVCYCQLRVSSSTLIYGLLKVWIKSDQYLSPISSVQFFMTVVFKHRLDSMLLVQIYEKHFYVLVHVRAGQNWQQKEFSAISM